MRARRLRHEVDLLDHEAAEAAGGGGLPDSWLVQEDGNVVARGDATSVVPLVVQAVDDQSGALFRVLGGLAQTGPLVDIRTETGPVFELDAAGFLTLSPRDDAGGLIVGNAFGTTGEGLTAIPAANGDMDVGLAPFAARLGFFGATPAAQPTAVADAAGGGTQDTEARAALNDLLAHLRTLGLIAT